MIETLMDFFAEGEVHFVLDLDGTLAEFRDFPDDVALSPRARAAITALSRFSVTILSGRTESDLQRILENIPAQGVGLNGNRNPDLRGACRIAAHLTEIATKNAHVSLEDKAPHFSLHYRISNQPEIGGALVSEIEDWLEGEKLSSAWRAYEGNYVVNVEPRGDFKRDWILRYLDEHPAAHVLFAGDDANDRGALELRHPRLRTVLVGTASHMESTRADFRTQNPGEFVRALESLSLVLPDTRKDSVP